MTFGQAIDLQGPGQNRAELDRKSTSPVPSLYLLPTTYFHIRYSVVSNSPEVDTHQGQQRAESSRLA